MAIYKHDLAVEPRSKPGPASATAFSVMPSVPDLERMAILEEHRAGCLEGVWEGWGLGVSRSSTMRSSQRRKRCRSASNSLPVKGPSQRRRWRKGWMLGRLGMFCNHNLFEWGLFFAGSGQLDLRGHPSRGHYSRCGSSPKQQNNDSCHTPCASG